MPKFNPENPDDPQFRPQFPLSQEAMRRIASHSQQVMRSAGTGEENDLGAGMGHQSGAELMPESFWARLTTPAQDAHTPLYSFCEVQDDGTGKGWTPPNSPIQGLYQAHEVNNDATLSIPGPPKNLQGTPAGTSLYYVVTAVWTKDGTDYQSGLSNEVGTTGGGGTLTWSAPDPAVGFALTGFKIWRSFPGQPGVECFLVATVSGSTLTYTDTGGGSFLMPIAGGTAGPIVRMYTKSIRAMYKFDSTNSADATMLAWVEATTSTPTQVFLGRTVTDATLNGTTTITSATANFTSADIGATLIGTGIPGSTTISSVTNSTTAIANNSMSAGTNVAVQIVTGSIKAYAATIETESTKTGAWSAGQTVWLQQANDSAWLPLVGGQEPVSVPVVSGKIYQCRYFGTDDNNTPIWTVAGHGITVTDGSTTVTEATTVKFLNATVANPTAGEADVTIGFSNNSAQTTGITGSWALTNASWTTYPNLSLTVPAAGTYLLWATVSVIVTDPSGAANAAVASIVLYDSTNAAQIGPAVICAGFNNQSTTNGYTQNGSGTVLWPHTCTGSFSLTFQAFLSAVGSGAASVMAADSSGTGCTSLGYLRIG